MSLQALYCFLPPCPPWKSSYSCQAIVLSCIPWRKTGIASFWFPDKTHAGTRGSNIWSLFCMLLVKSTVLRIKARWSVLVVWISWQVWVVFFWAYRPSSVLCGVWCFAFLFFLITNQNSPDKWSCVRWLQYLHLGWVKVIICLIICSTELGPYCACEKWLKKGSAVHFSLFRLRQKAPPNLWDKYLIWSHSLCHILLICCGEQVRSHSFVNLRQLTLPWLNGRFMNIQSLLLLPGKQHVGSLLFPPAGD